MMRFTLGVCNCGCRTEIPIMAKNRYTIQKFVKGHYPKAGLHHNFRNRLKHSDGYLLMHSPNHPFAAKKHGYIMAHRLIWENYNNAILLPWAHVHHLDKNRKNNDIKNLIAMMDHEHLKLEAQLNPYSFKKGHKIRTKRKVKSKK